MPALIADDNLTSGSSSAVLGAIRSSSGLFSRLQNQDTIGLFIEELGWDHASGAIELEVKGQVFVLVAQAQKRGFHVFTCKVEQHAIIDRYLLRKIQKQLAEKVHEHIIVYLCDDPARQVWQWGMRTLEGSKLRHLEHPFLSTKPPPRLLQRLDQLRFTFAEEEAVTLIDAVSRVRQVLSCEPDYELFVKRPGYARRSDELARAMETGGIKEFQDFILWHHGLIPYFAKRWHRSLHVDEDEAQQLFALGLMNAAKQFNPHLGYQFATYASMSARRVARQLASNSQFPIRLPLYVLPTCYESQRVHRRVFVAEGPRCAREAVEELLAGVRQPVAQACQVFDLMMNRKSLSDRRDTAWGEARQIAANKRLPDHRIIRGEVFTQLHELVDRLGERERNIVRLYYGFDGEPRTMQEIGDQVNLTRERVRQILSDCYKHIRRSLDLDPADIPAILPMVG